MLGVGEFRGPGNKTLNPYIPFHSMHLSSSLQCSGSGQASLGALWSSWAQKSSSQGSSGGGLGLERICRDPGRVRAERFGSRGRAERYWATGSDPKRRAGNLAAYLVLKRVSENLPPSDLVHPKLSLSALRCPCCFQLCPTLLPVPVPEQGQGKWEQSCRRG